MGTIRTPGKHDCLAKAFPHEPMFTLLARDPEAPLVIRLWANLRQRGGESPEKVREAENLAYAMEVHMSYMDGPATDGDVEKCRRLATLYHRGQTDVQGVPYFEHLRDVAAQVYGRTAKCIAFLHDCIEDGRATYDMLAHERVPLTVIDGVRVLTRNPNMPYEEYIMSVKLHDCARTTAVKVADLRSNMRPGCPTSLYRRYAQALERLMAAP